MMSQVLEARQAGRDHTVVSKRVHAGSLRPRRTASEEALRELAFVLHLSERVRNDILAENGCATPGR